MDMSTDGTELDSVNFMGQVYTKTNLKTVAQNDQK